MGVRQEKPKLARALDKGVTLVFTLLGKLISRPKQGSPEKARPTQPLVDPYEVAISRARVAYDSGQLGEALHLFSAVIELSPHEPWGWHGRGDCLQLTNEYADAKKAYEKAVEFGGGAYSHFGVGNACQGLGDTQGARVAWQLALDADPALALAEKALSSSG